MFFFQLFFFLYNFAALIIMRINLSFTDNAVLPAENKEDFQR